MHQENGSTGLTQQHRLSELRSTLSEWQDQPVTNDDLSVLATFLVDATLDADEETLGTALTWLQWQYGRRRQTSGTPAADAESGAFLGFIHIAQWALQRVPVASSVPAVEPGTHAARFLQALSAVPGLSNAKLAAELGADETEVSRVGRGLIEKSLATRRRLGRFNSWEITPRGRRTLTALAAMASGADEGATGYGPIGPAERETYGNWRQDAQQQLLSQAERLNLRPADEAGTPLADVPQGAAVAVS